MNGVVSRSIAQSGIQEGRGRLETKGGGGSLKGDHDWGSVRSPDSS
jgi:hypothetical protein